MDTALLFSLARQLTGDPRGAEWELPVEYLYLHAVAVPSRAANLNQQFFESVEANGVLVPIVIDTSGRRAWIKDGRHRVAAAHQLGHEFVPAVLYRTWRSR